MSASRPAPTGSCVRLDIRPRTRALEPTYVVEVVTPRTNIAALTSAENLFAGLALAEPFSVELAADSTRRRFLVRASGEHMRHHLASQLAAAYPQAELRTLDPEVDPATTRPRERVIACALQLRAAAYLPIRTFNDVDLDAQRSSQADPLLGIVGALGDLPPGWRGISQLVLQPAPEDWCRDFQRYAVQHPLEHERLPRQTETPALGMGFIGLSLAIVFAAIQLFVWYRAGAWLPIIGAFCSAPALIALVATLSQKLKPAVYDMDLVRDKVTRIAYHAELRLAVFGPPDASDRALQARLQRCVAAYRHFNLAAANGFKPRVIQAEGRDFAKPLPMRRKNSLAILTTRELAGLWHLPQAADDIPLVERTTARHWLPIPDKVASGCRIGVSVHLGREIPVAVPDDVLRRHLLLVAKTRRGKSTLMLRLAHHAMQTAPTRGVLLIDPHRDLAEAALGIVPPERHADVVFVDAAATERPVGLNMLDVGLGWPRDRAVANALSIFQREWGDQFWGPRMEDVFRFALLALIDANTATCAAQPEHGRANQYTLLDIPDLLGHHRFRRQVLSSVTDQRMLAWWNGYFERLDPRFRDEVINPVVTKIHRFAGTDAARRIVGQAESSIDPVGWIRDGAIVIVHTGRGAIGENAAALIGSTLLNLVSLAIADQAQLEPELRNSVAIFVDEFHTIPGADYEAILAELNKFGANLVLATQSLERLVANGAADGSGRGLRATVFANLDGLFAFNCSAEDATYLVPELGGALDEQDLVELGEYECYVRLTSAGRRLPSFSVKLDPPLPSNSELRAHLAAASAERYGRPVNLDVPQRLAPAPETPQPSPTPRNQHRPRKANKREAAHA
jgi:hypothetical protein